MGILDSSSTGSAAAPVPQADGDSSPVGSVDAYTYVVVTGDDEANRDLIKDPNLIYPGQQLRIPE